MNISIIIIIHSTTLGSAYHHNNTNQITDVKNNKQTNNNIKMYTHIDTNTHTFSDINSHWHKVEDKILIFYEDDRPLDDHSRPHYFVNTLPREQPFILHNNPSLMYFFIFFLIFFIFSLSSVQKKIFFIFIWVYIFVFLHVILCTLKFLKRIIICMHEAWNFFWHFMT